MAQYGTWVSYGGTADIALAIVLAGAATAVTYAGLRLRLPAPLPRPRRAAKVFLLVAWLLSIAALGACTSIDVRHIVREHQGLTPPVDPITVICLGIVWFALALLHNARGWRIALGSAVIGAVAAPMIFELPFDLIVMGRTYPPIPPDPFAYRVLFFAPLILVELTTLALLTLSPLARLTRATSKILAFLTALSMFMPDRSQPSRTPQPAHGAWTSVL